jgi:predicted membrane channel-forming protein YqfA (hemolysin III family)
VSCRSPPNDPHPEAFGYHEVWHTFVVGATACHVTLVLLLAHP